MQKSILILITALCLLGCSSSKDTHLEISDKRIDEVNARIDKTIADSARAQALKDVVARLDRQLKVHAASLDQKRVALVTASADYTTTRSDLEALYDGINAETRAIMTLLKEAYGAMAHQVTPEEWGSIIRGKKRLFELN